jgi:ribonuclease P protein subunit POP4
MANVLKREFIGMHTHVVRATDPRLENLRGDILDETKNLFVIETSCGVKKVPKRCATFDIKGVTVDGKQIAFRPEDRVRKIK